MTARICTSRRVWTFEFKPSSLLSSWHHPDLGDGPRPEGRGLSHDRESKFSKEQVPLKSGTPVRLFSHITSSYVTPKTLETFIVLLYDNKHQRNCTTVALPPATAYLPQWQDKITPDSKAKGAKSLKLSHRHKRKRLPTRDRATRKPKPCLKTDRKGPMIKVGATANLKA